MDVRSVQTMQVETKYLRLFLQLSRGRLGDSSNSRESQPSFGDPNCGPDELQFLGCLNWFDKRGNQLSSNDTGCLSQLAFSSDEHAYARVQHFVSIQS